MTLSWLAFLGMPFFVMAVVAFCIPFMVDCLPSALARALASTTIITIAAGAVMCSVGLSTSMRLSFYEKLRVIYGSLLTALGR